MSDGGHLRRLPPVHHSCKETMHCCQAIVKTASDLAGQVIEAQDLLHGLSLRQHVQNDFFSHLFFLYK